MAFLDTLWMALQPIVDLRTGQVIGHEALVRGPAATEWPTPDGIFRTAHSLGQERQLEETCRRLALTVRRRQLPDDQRLFLNVDLQHQDLPLDPDGGLKRPEQVAIEISERLDFLNNPRALKDLQGWRDAGYMIVLDDYGTGYSSLGTLLAVQPDVVKLDRYIVGSLDRNRQHRTAVEAVVGLAKDLGIKVVAEGVETMGELRALRKIGVDYGQGFLLGRPEPAPAPTVCPVVVHEGAIRSTPGASEAAADPNAIDLFHETLFGACREGVYFVDRRRTILKWNEAAEKISGYDASEVIGRRCLDNLLDHVDDFGVPLCNAVCPLVHAMADGLPRRAVVLLRHKLGHRERVSITAIPVRNAENQVLGAVEIFEHVGDPFGKGPTEGIATGV